MCVCLVYVICKFVFVCILGRGLEYFTAIYIYKYTFFNAHVKKEKKNPAMMHRSESWHYEEEEKKKKNDLVLFLINE